MVNPMEVFAAMSASLLEKQPKPFNPMYAIKSTPPPPLKIGGKPPREIFYRDTLTFMTTLPPPVQAKTCTCKYLCAGEKATIICHSCSIYDPTKAAYYCSKCFPARHPWYRAPHLHTPIENDESISHTLKIAHRIAEASRYDNEGQDILRKVQNQKPNLAFVADDVKVDDQLRAYGRKVTALEQHVLQLRERLQRDIMFGDVVPVRRSLYSHNTAESITEQGLIKMGDDSSTATPSGQDSDRSELLELGQARYTGPAHRKLELLRREPVFDSEPLFTSLQDDTEGPETLTPPGVGQNVVAGTTGIAVGKPALFIRAPLLRGDTAESTDSMTLSPEGEGGFFRDDSNMNLVRSLGPQLDAIEEADSIVTEGASNKASLQDTATAAAGAMVATESSMHSLADTIASQNEAVGGADANTEKQTAELDSGSRAAYVVGSEYSGDETSVPSPGIKRVLSGLSFTSVAHSEIDSVSVPAAQAQRQAQVQMPSLVSELTLPTIADRGEPQSGKSQSSNWLGSIASVDTSHSGGSAESSSTAAGSIHSYGDVSTLSKSSTNIQRIFKGYLARRTVSKMLTTRLYRVFCLEVNRGELALRGAIVVVLGSHNSAK